MRRAAEDLHGKSRLDAACALFQISDVLLLGFADASKRGAEANAHAILRVFARIVDARVLQRELCGHDCELSVTIQPFQAVRWKVVFGIPIANFAGALHTEHTRVEACNAVDTAFFCEDPVPKPIHAGADACDRPDTGDDGTSSSHAAILSAFSSR